MTTPLLRQTDYPVTREEQSRWAAAIARPLMEGEVDPLEFIVKLKGLSAAIAEVEKNKEVKDIVLGEISKHGKEANWHGTRLIQRETGVRYDFSGCNDPIYNELLKQKEELEAKVKEREQFLKFLPGKTTVIDPETGEVCEIYPAVRMASDSYAITFSKQ